MQRWVTAVGGTQLQYGWTWQPTSDVPFLRNGDYNPASPAAATPSRWNETWLPAATGGGPSVIYPRSSWQAAQASIIGRNARGEPDLSWKAAVNGGVLVWITAFPSYQRPGWHVYGGTSASSQVAGLIALANEQQAKAGQPPLGFLNPLLYRVGDQAGAATARRSATSTFPAHGLMLAPVAYPHGPKGPYGAAGEALRVTARRLAGSGSGGS